ncbi:hypothetical protein BURPS406E_R0173 [Burkholderia pseudomallei 406e]|uniref:Uncharacterized protein n=3 Tax=pseudomallei group TaxID=111527 RepID=A2SAL7_BURM9|nr:hypothetical protein BMASAVP1_A0975 [Burkholderia mallei SAVP1]ABN03086.1 hypothetical protein BMA10229_A3042 [Burkholderia mallei NCTC 10229]ABN84110.1 hypothetical protein BURPS668_1114 [Burkholderia pseudomallei 668]ABN91437.1 hypothetical protein BURPS1106A_1120 [Burkholderia pseudomallei 1106a]ABO06456.1 hypothetical protein BMA10247_1551 [Burkholderia mallei NCTC 10247]ACQ96406.1 conserved hypothetical protein [Burkholderia pseudomallei MSHR346]AFR14997.1 hypothetical protein BPC006_
MTHATHARAAVERGGGAESASINHGYGAAGARDIDHTNRPPSSR